MKINLIGNLFGSSGYSTHTRQLFNALYELSPEIHLDTPLPQGWELLCNDAELSCITRPHYDDGVTVMVSMPQFWNQGKNQPCKAFYGVAVWEGDKVPKSWVPLLWKTKGVLVPSQHVKDAILKTIQEVAELDKHLYDGWEVENIEMPFLHVVPHGVDPVLFQSRERPKDAPFVFLANKGWAQGENDRGGLQYLFRAFAEEFKRGEPVQLKVKVNAAYCPPGWDLATELTKLGLPDDRAEIQVSALTVEYKALPAFYDGDVFVSPTMGEAFSIPCAEAMAMGIPVITTGYGGQTDYLTEENGWLLPYELFEVTHDVSYEGIKWARPDIKELRRLMRYAYEHRDEVCAKGSKAREDILAYSWRASAQKLLEVITKDNGG